MNYIQYMQSGGTTEINTDTTLAQQAVDYIHSYYNSDGFKARRKQYNWQRGEPRRIRRRMDRTTIPINYVQGGGDKSQYDYHRNEINVGSNPLPSMAGQEQYTIPVAETAAHEVTHAYDYPKTNIYGQLVAEDDSYKERGYYSSLPIELYNKYFTNLPGWTSSYRRRTDEQYADLGGLRAMIYLATGYDSRQVDDKGNPIPISDEQWNAFKQTDYYKNNRFIKTHGDERSRSALQEIAQNNPQSSFERQDGTYLAAFGGNLNYLNYFK